LNLKCRGTWVENSQKRAQPDTANPERTRRKTIRSKRVLFYEVLQMFIVGISLWKFVRRKLPLTTILAAVIKLFFQLLFYLSAWYLIYDFLILSLLSSLRRKWNCSYRLVAFKGGSGRKTLRGNFQVKKKLLEQCSPTTSIATPTWGTSLLGFLPARVYMPYNLSLSRILSFVPM
jgi:hypothetical protein